MHSEDLAAMPDMDEDPLQDLASPPQEEEVQDRMATRASKTKPVPAQIQVSSRSSRYCLQDLLYHFQWRYVFSWEIPFGNWTLMKLTTEIDLSEKVISCLYFWKFGNWKLVHSLYKCEFISRYRKNIQDTWESEHRWQWEKAEKKQTTDRRKTEAYFRVL